jgi:GNAT superfamily N-acetyltransferase
VTDLAGDGQVRACRVAVTRDEDPVATGRGVADSGWTGVFDLATRPEARRQGAGTAVLAALAGWSEQQGAPRLYLQVDSPAALGLYARAGFRELCTYHYRTRGLG